MFLNPDDIRAANLEQLHNSFTVGYNSAFPFESNNPKLYFDIILMRLLGGVTAYCEVDNEEDTILKITCTSPKYKINRAILQDLILLKFEFNRSNNQIGTLLSQAIKLDHVVAYMDDNNKWNATPLSSTDVSKKIKVRKCINCGKKRLLYQNGDRL